MKIKSYAKINLALDVLKKSGKYHEIRTVFQQIGLHDELIFKKIDAVRAGQGAHRTVRRTFRPKIIVRCSDKTVPVGSKNTVVKAARLLHAYATAKNAAGKSPQKNLCDVEVTIKKNIPGAAGLGGGSSNGATALIALNRLWRMHLSKKKMMRLAAHVGMDAPFFISGGTAIGAHLGERITPLPAFKLPPMLIALNSRKTATSNIYRMLDLKKTAKKTHLTTALINALKAGKRSNSLFNVRNLFHNDFETLLGHKKMVKTNALFGLLVKTGADAAGLCGSGPAVYALYKNRLAQKNAYKALSKQKLFVWKST